MQAHFWKFFHYGTVAGLHGIIPSDIAVFVEIQYLQAMFSGHGEGFEVRLRRCTAITYNE
ncbi:MAG: hypothetical protein M0Q15_04865 [Nevskia sp.]|nr:hypothetical protein [Nevskia sp.]